MKKEISSTRAAWSITQTNTSANGGHLIIDVVTYGFAPLLSSCATLIQLSRSSECAERGHAAITAPRPTQAQPRMTSKSLTAVDADGRSHGRADVIPIRFYNSAARKNRPMRFVTLTWFMAAALALVSGASAAAP